MSNFAALIATIQANIKTNGNEEITGAVLQDVLEAMVQALGTEAINNLETALGNEETARQNADGTLQNHIDAEALRAGMAEAGLDGRLDTIEGEIPSAASSSNKLTDKAYVDAADLALQTAINGIKSDIENGYVYAGIATSSGTPVTGKVFYLAVTAGTYTNFGGLVVTQGINILKYNGTAWSQEQLIAIDNEPIVGSDNLVKSGGVLSMVSLNNIATTDITAQHTKIFDDVKKGDVLFFKVNNSPNNLNFAISKVPDWISNDILCGLELGKETQFIADDDYGELYLIIHQSAGISDISFSYGKGKVSSDAVLFNDFKINTDILIGEDKFYNHTICVPRKGQGIGGPSITDFGTLSPFIDITGYKWLLAKNLYQYTDSYQFYALNVYNASYQRIAGYKPTSVENFEAFNLRSFIASGGKYIAFMPTREQNLLSNSYIRLTNRECNIDKSVYGEIESNREKIDEALMIARSYDYNKGRVYTELDCQLKGISINRSGAYYADQSTVDFYTSDYIDLSGVQYVSYQNVYPNASANAAGLHLYDENKQHIAVIGTEGVTSPINGIITLSNYPTAKYLRFSINYSEDYNSFVHLYSGAHSMSPYELDRINLINQGIFCNSKVLVEKIVTDGNVSIKLTNLAGGNFLLATANNGIIQDYTSLQSGVVYNGGEASGFDALYAKINIAGSISLFVGNWAYRQASYIRTNEKYIPLVLFSGDEMVYGIQGFVTAKNEYILDASGNGDFTSIGQCVGLPKNAIVHVRAGRYKTTTYTAFDNGISFIGEDIDKCVVYNDDNDYQKAIMIRSGLWKNLTFEAIYDPEKPDASNSYAYSVHIDHAEPVADVFFGVRFENCKFISHNYTCVGMGMRKDFKVTFVGCDFILCADSRGGYALSSHNVVNNAPAALQGAGLIEIVNCRLYNENNQGALAFALKTTNGSSADGILDQYPTRWVIINSSFYSAISGNDCVMANNTNGVYALINTIPSAVVLDPRSYGNNVSMLNA